MEVQKTERIHKSFMPIEVKDIDIERRVIRFIGTNETQDRSGDIIMLEGWKLANFMANPVFLWSHNGRSNPPIGRALEVSLSPKGLVFDIEFATKDVFEFADNIFKLYVAGFLKGVSVGFIPIRAEFMTDPNSGDFIGIKFLEQELIELSAVSIPDNPTALITEASEGALSKDAQAFLIKSMEEERSVFDVIESLKKEISDIIEKKGSVNDMADETKVVEVKDLDNRLQIVENKLLEFENVIKELQASHEMQKTTVEAFDLVKQIFVTIKEKGNADNAFIDLLDPGTAPKGTPKEMNDVLEAIAKTTKAVASKDWTPSS